MKRLEVVNQWISNVDTKSSFVLTFYGVIITIIFTSNLGKEMINTFTYRCASSIDCNSFKLFFSLLVVILFITAIIITIYNIYQTLRGRINPNIYKQRRLKTNSNIFFGTIVSKSYSDFENQITNESKSTFLKDLNSQIYINSNIADNKFKHYNNSIMWLIISLGLFLTFIIIN